jgi:predicted porin
MKKIAISAMLISLMGLAQAQLTVYGRARVFEESTTVGSAASVMSLTNDTSRIGFKATEKLDNDLSANVVIETGYGADAPTAATLGDRISLISLANKYASVGFGRDKHAVARTLDNFDALANAFGSSASVIHTPQGSRLQNAMFLSATPMTGVTVNYQNANSEVPGTNNAQVVSIDYAVGPLAASVGRYNNGTTSASNIVAAKFKYSNTTVFGMYSNDTISNVGSNGKSVGINQAIGATTLLASYGEKEGTKAYDLGATYNLSKNTMLHARYVNESSTVDTKKIGVGMEINF